jgi:hypothetical protein
MAQNDDTTVENVDWPSLDEVYTEVKDRISSQNDRNKTIDGKANFGLAAATLLTAGVTGLSKVVGDVATKSNVGKQDFILFHAHLGTVADWITVACRLRDGSDQRLHGLSPARVSRVAQTPALG